MSPPIHADADDAGGEDAARLALLKDLHRAERGAVASRLLRRTVRLDRLTSFLVAERMGVYVHARMAALGLGRLLPPALAEPIRCQYEDQRRRNARMLALLYETLPLFARRGIDLMVVKGLPMAERFWGGIDQRFSFDLDLFVRREEFPRAARLLASRGFAAPRLVPASERLSLRLSHALELTRDGLSIDLHWTLRNRPGLRFDLDAIWSGAEPATLEGLQVRTLSDTHLLLMLLTGLANDLERGHHRFRSFWDIYMLLNGLADIDWRVFLSAHDDEGLGVLLVNLLALVLVRLDCRAEFPELAAALDQRCYLLRLRGRDETETLFVRRAQRLSNRRWFAGLLPVPAWRYWAWWAGTLPLRYLLGRHI